MSFNILINSHSGTVLALGEDKIRTLVEASGVDCKSLHILPPEEFFPKMVEMMEDDTPLLVGAGDGTISKTASLHLKKGKAFGILPCGTMNMLALDLHIPIDFSQAIDAYADTEIIPIDVGMVRDRVFLCCASFGTMPEAAKLREKTRHLPALISIPRVAATVLRSLDYRNRRNVHLTLDNRAKKFKIGMLVISNNRYNPVSAAEPFKKDDLQDGILGVYMVSTHSLWDKIRFFIRLKTGGWRRDQTVIEDRAQTIIMKTQRGSELISVDGEPELMTMPLEFKIMPKALKVIVPVIKPIPDTVLLPVTGLAEGV